MTSTIHIIGAGPSGLIAAQTLAQAGGYDIHIHERKPSPARKLLMAGRGGLNLTHSEDLGTFLSRYGAARTFLEPLIRAFPPDDLRAWCENLEQETFVGSSGRVFPKSMKASPLLRAWLARLDSMGVHFHYRQTWTGWTENGDLNFADMDGKQIAAKSDATLLTLGGGSWPSLGSDASWQSILAAKSVEISPLKAANCGFHITWSDFIRDRFAGTPLKSIALSACGQTVQGEIMIDRNGIEGGAVYALSAGLRDEIDRSGSVTINIDLRPSMTKDAIVQKLSHPRGRQSFSTWFQKAMNLSPLAIALLHESNPKVSALPIDQVADLIKSCRLTATAPFPIDRAISSAGGIALPEFDGNLMIARLPGVFAAGEMLDWEAPTGGYLLQACFATGIAAAQGILAYNKGK